jgi:hypothetical protein
MSLLFSIIYATCRPQEILKHYAHWQERTKDLMSCEFIFAIDELDPASLAVAANLVANTVEKSRWGGLKLCVVPRPSRNCIIAWNTAAKIAEGKVFMVTSDDFTVPAGWDDWMCGLKCNCGTLCRDKIKETGLNRLTTPWWEHSHVVHTDDGHTSLRHGICTFPIITMKWYKRHGYVYHPSYTELFGDQELCVVGYRDNAMISVPDLKITHLHYTVKKRGFDEHDERHSTREAWNRDEANFNHRKKLGFPSCFGEHWCNCGTAKKTPHRIGEDGCVRFMVAAPFLLNKDKDIWLVDGQEVTGFTLHQQRGYDQHPCCCWSRWPGSSNSITA